MEGVGLREKNEGGYHKFVHECNLIPLVTEGCMKKSQTPSTAPSWENLGGVLLVLVLVTT